MSMLQEFKDFALKGNVLDLAVGVVVGAAFGRIVDSAVSDLIMPIIGAVGGADFSNYFIPLSKAITATNLEDARKQGAVLAYGHFITVAVNFLIVAFFLFLVVKAFAALKRSTPPAPPAPPVPTVEETLLVQIRDILAAKR